MIIQIYGGGSNDSFSSKLCLLALVGFVVFIRSLHSDGGIFESGSGTRKNGLSRGSQEMYDAYQRDA